MKCEDTDCFMNMRSVPHTQGAGYMVIGDKGCEVLCKYAIMKEDDEGIDHPNHYGGADNPYEAIKVIEAWDLNFNLGNVLKYIARRDSKETTLINLKKAAWYLNREIERISK